ncbi:MAG: chemotaxis protein CheW [bacterium]|nr:chemotaxis protein CheW [bacterium]
MNNNYIEQKKNTHLYFEIDGSKYAINTNNILEIMKLPALDYPSKLPNNVVGLLKYNNFVINVIDIRFYLNIEATPYTTSNDLLIVKTDEIIFGIITDKIIGILPFDSSFVDQIPFADDNMIVESLYKHDEETIFIVNIYSIEILLKGHHTNFPEIDIPSLMPKDAKSKALMLKRTHDMLEKASVRLAASGGQVKNKYISLNLGNDFYCISLDYVKEILNDTAITKVPGVSDFISGIMNLRGDYVTVIDIKKFLGLTETQNQIKKPIIIIQYNELTLAFLVDKINEIFEFEEFTEGNGSDSYYLCEFINDTVLYTVLNIDKIASDKRLVVTEM